MGKSGRKQRGEARVALVTGGSRGIGREVVRRLACDGYSLVVGYAGRADAAAEAAREAVELGGLAVTTRADVGDEADVARLFDRAEETFGGIDVVVHAAGRMDLAPVADFDLATFDALIRTNLRGSFLVAQQAARRVRDGGAIVAFSSSVLGLAQPGYAAYAASKGAVEAMILILARELRGRDVTVNAVAPGPTATDLFLDGKDPDTVDRLAKTAPLERLGTPADIAEAVAFLAGPGHWINGQTLRANGGII